MRHVAGRSDLAHYWIIFMIGSYYYTIVSYYYKFDHDWITLPHSWIILLHTLITLLHTSALMSGTLTRVPAAAISPAEVRNRCAGRSARNT